MKQTDPNKLKQQKQNRNFDQKLKGSSKKEQVKRNKQKGKSK